LAKDGPGNTRQCTYNLAAENIFEIAVILHQALVGADPRVCPEFTVLMLSKEGRHVGLPLPVVYQTVSERKK